MAFDADDLHPMRFLRQLPAARAIIRREVHHCRNGLLSSDAFQRIADAGMTAYNQALGKLPFEKRPESTDAAVDTVSTLAHLVSFAAGGRNSFWLPPQLVALLGQTDLGDIRLAEGVDDVRKDGFPISSPHLSGYERAALFNQAALPTASNVLALLCNALCLLSTEPALGAPEWPKQAPSTLVDAIANATTPKRLRTAVGRLADDGYFSVRRLNFHTGAVEIPADGAPDSSLPGREVAAHWRRSHWRRQPHGPGLSERRLIWIRSALVRQDRGEPAVGHLYAVTE
ncbi:hypothetical protein ACI7BZ_21465 [Xanthobacter sp. AM11]|uniref:hypothetical protein n=1 Tax=Xanthobacter sp. AM11 TaxID=3380643 RepID=UPI0039BFF8DB